MTEKDWFTESGIDEYTRKLVDLVLEIAEAADGNCKEYFIGGGFAIDFSIGRITRNHHDIDFHPMLMDSEWWVEWFKGQGYKVKKKADPHFSETYKIKDEQGESIVDMWPLKLEGGVLLIKHDNEYVDSGRHWDEARTVIFENVGVRVENPERVLEQKSRHSQRNKKLRKQDEHDFRLFEKELRLD